MALDFSAFETIGKKTTSTEAPQGAEKVTPIQTYTPAPKNEYRAPQSPRATSAPKRAIKEPTRGGKGTTFNDLERVEALKRDIITGIRGGLREYTLLLKAVEAISLLSGDSLGYFKQVKYSLETLQGEGLEKELPLEWLLQEIQQESYQLETKLKKPTLTPEVKAELEEALKYHRMWEKDLKDNIREPIELFASNG